MDTSFKHLKIDLVTEEDEEKVLSIRNTEEIYCGADYLPFCFKHLLNFPNATGYAVLHDETYIAFALVNIYDKYETCIIRALRISKQYEKQGIIRWFISEIHERVKEKYSVKYAVSASGRENEDTIRRVKEGRCYTVADREMEHFENGIEIDELESMLGKINLNGIVVIEENTLSNILESQSVTNEIFGTRLVVNRVPFRPIKSNVRFIMQETTSVIGSNIDDAKCLLITFGTQYEAFVGTVVFIDIYRNAYANLRNHIQFHLKRVKRKDQNTKINIKLCFDAKAKVCIEGIMRDVGFVYKERAKSGLWCTEMKL